MRSTLQEEKRMNLLLWCFASLCIHLLLCLAVSGCRVPPPNIVCMSGNERCKVYNHRGLWDDNSQCTASAAYFPISESELVDAVATAVKTNRTVSVISRLAHSLLPLMCVHNAGVIISTRDLSTFAYVDTREQTITVDSGMHMLDVLDEAAKFGLTLYDAVGWDGVTAAGCISTGAHGTGLRAKGSGVYEYVVGLRMIVSASSSQGYAKVVELTQSDEELKAARVSLGTLGVISRVTFQLMPMFKRSIVPSVIKDDKLEDIIHDVLTVSDFGSVLWSVGVRRAITVSNLKVPVNVSGDSTIFFTAVQPMTVQSIINDSVSYDRLHKTGDIEELCAIGEAQIPAPAENATAITAQVGFNHKMVTSGGCEDYHLRTDPSPACLLDKILDANETVCQWDRRVEGRKIFDMEIRVPLSRARDAILDIKKLREISPAGAFCALSNYIFLMRSIKKSEAYLGPKEDVVTFEFFQYRPNTPYTPTLYMDVFQELEQMLIEKHGGHLHWGKSGGYLFEGQAQRKMVDFKGFMKVKRKYDPHGVFSNHWTDGLLKVKGKRVRVLKDRCALDKMCKCTQDSHCAPSEGYLCKPGRLWEHARVCRKV